MTTTEPALLDQLRLLLQDPDGNVHGCGCGQPHPPATSSLSADPYRWRKIRRAILRRDGGQCQVPIPEPDDMGDPQVCGEPAVVCGHVLARAFGGCDHPGNLRAECDVHSRSDGAAIGNDLRAAAALLAAVQRGDLVTPILLDDLVHHDPGMKVLSPSDQHNRRSTGVTAEDRAALEPPEPANLRNDASGAWLSVPGPGDACWDVPWLKDLRAVPEDATWPRLMTLPHPRAVGSYGLEVERQFTERTGRQPRWWQRLMWRRLLEHDADGALVWLQVLLTLSRQLGKSWGLRELNVWRCRQTDRWGDQLVVHTGKDVPIVQEVMQPAMVWAERQGSAWSVVWNNGKWELSRTVEPAPVVCPECGGWPAQGPRTLRGRGPAPCDRCGGAGRVPSLLPPQTGRWIGKSFRQVYGFAATQAVVDEGWKVPSRAVDDGLLPTLVEQISPQLLLVSTAHPECTALMLDNRVASLAQLFDPVDRLLLEWSSPRSLAVEDRRGWRMASPHWTPQRERLIAGALEKARTSKPTPDEPDPMGSFVAQWLNRWPHPDDVENVNPDERVATDDAWGACLDPDAQPDPQQLLVLVVEDDLGTGAAAAAAQLMPDGRVVLGGHAFGTLREAVDWCDDTAEAGLEAGACVDAVLLAGASIAGDPEVDGATELPVEPVGTAEFRTSLATLRDLARRGRLAHDGAESVTRSVLDARVPRDVTGGGMLVRNSSALLRCVAWAVHRAYRDRF